MSTARDEILGKIRGALKRGALPQAKVAALETRIAEHRRNLIPARAASLGEAERVDLFVRMAEEVQTTVARVSDARAVPAAIADYLVGLNLPSELVLPGGDALAEIPWNERPLLRIRRGLAEDADLVGVTPAAAAIAETGTLMLVSGADAPTRNNFLPDTHIVVLRRNQIHAGYEEALDRIRAAMPRTVNFITGPSRTADIEQRLELGAHGPRRLHIVLIDDVAPQS